MKCPRCTDANLGEFSREGIRVDACPQCHGIWLDKGELEQLISRSRKHHDDDDDEGGHRSHEHHDHSGRHEDKREHHEGHKRLKSRRWLEGLGDLFD
jgi:Zn-finger nucleic acid-binding protein